ncbi:hypothetical protein ETAA8_66170 [Anatilimnocola aggregata]|uniref:HEAT repeat domain-containing protein n=1 Tax=Anatilimnocola aggregata TaxID=2528021 RepID=A0A517YMK6_9BACT|nr:hypothetical protein [Anatilimnocola aggregata]QDU31459.1 hypothetical protein ETAA8_66170 [Anatilimnocola aggregata]
MLKRLLAYLFSPPDDPGIVRATPAEIANDRILRGDIPKLTTQELTRVCEEYWAQFPDPTIEVDTAAKPPLPVSSGRYWSAVAELRGRGPEIINWVCSSLSHSNYDARELAATFIGDFAERNELGPARQEAEDALVACAIRVPQYDGKEAQANDVALRALKSVGGKAIFGVIRYILTADEWKEDDLRWSAVEVLGDLTSQPFLEEPEPELAAQQWLAAHPEG